MQAVLVGAILTSEFGAVDPAQAQVSQITNDSQSRQNNIPSLDSLKKRSAVIRWNNQKIFQKPGLWKSARSTLNQSPSVQDNDQPVFEEPKQMLLDQRRFKNPQNTGVKSNVYSTGERPLPVFNFNGNPVRKYETFNLPGKLRKPQAPPNFKLRVSEEPRRSPVLSTFNSSSDPAASNYPQPVIRLDPTIRVDAQTEEAFRIPPKTPQAPSRSSSRTSGYKPTPLQKVTEISPFADYVPKGYGMEDQSQSPKTEPLDLAPYQERNFEEIVYTWEPTNLSYNPLYFEDAPLERYGHTHHELLQPFISATRFGVQLVGLPYQMTIDPIYKKRYALGYYLPGDYAPKKFYQIPLNLDAALVEAGALTGMIFLIP